MSDALINAVAARAAEVLGRVGQPRWGVVRSVDPTRPAVRVLIQPEGVLTGWLPVLQQAAGGGWAVLTVPTPGQQCFVVPDTGDAGNGVVVGFAQSDAARLPQVAATEGAGGTPNPTATPARAGETLLTGPGGQVIRLGPDGIYMRGTVRIDGDLRVNGDVRDRIGSLAGLRTNYNIHVHGGVQAGGSYTLTTFHPDP